MNDEEFRGLARSAREGRAQREAFTRAAITDRLGWALAWVPLDRSEAPRMIGEVFVQISVGSDFGSSGYAVAVADLEDALSVSDDVRQECLLVDLAAGIGRAQFGSKRWRVAVALEDESGGWTSKSGGSAPFPEALASALGGGPMQALRPYGASGVVAAGDPHAFGMSEYIGMGDFVPEPGFPLESLPASGVAWTPPPEVAWGGLAEETVDEPGDADADPVNDLLSMVSLIDRLNPEARSIEPFDDAMKITEHFLRRKQGAERPITDPDTIQPEP